MFVFDATRWIYGCVVYLYFYVPHFPLSIAEEGESGREYIFHLLIS